MLVSGPGVQVEQTSLHGWFVDDH